MIESIQIVTNIYYFKIINCLIYLNHIRQFSNDLLKKKIYNNFNLINEWSIMDILYNITFPNNLILD